MPRTDSPRTTVNAPLSPSDVEADLVAFSAVAGVELSAPQAIGAGGLSEAVLFDLENVDMGGAYDPLTGAYTAPENGAYHVSGVLFGPPTTFQAQIQVDLGPGKVYDSFNTPNSSAAIGVAVIDYTVDLSAGQTITVFCEDTAGAGMNVGAGSCATFTRVS